MCPQLITIIPWLIDTGIFQLNFHVILLGGILDQIFLLQFFLHYLMIRQIYCSIIRHLITISKLIARNLANFHSRFLIPFSKRIYTYLIFFFFIMKAASLNEFPSVRKVIGSRKRSCGESRRKVLRGEIQWQASGDIFIIIIFRQWRLTNDATRTKNVIHGAADKGIWAKQVEGWARGGEKEHLLYLCVCAPSPRGAT